MNKEGQFDRSLTCQGGADCGGGKTLLFKEADGKIRTELLDIYEAKQLGLTIDMGHSQTLDGKINYILNRLYKIAPFRANAYKQWAAEFLNGQAQFVEHGILPVTTDLGATVLPFNAEIIQVAIQRNDEDSRMGLPRYIVDRNVFQQMDLESQAALMIHEIVYREFRSLGVNNSLRARYLTGVILSKEISYLDKQKFNSILEKVSSPCSENWATVVNMDVASTCSIFPLFYNDSAHLEIFPNLQFKKVAFKQFEPGKLLATIPHGFRLDQLAAQTLEHPYSVLSLSPINDHPITISKTPQQSWSENRDGHVIYSYSGEFEIDYSQIELVLWEKNMTRDFGVLKGVCKIKGNIDQNFLNFECRNGEVSRFYENGQINYNHQTLYDNRNSTYTFKVTKKRIEFTNHN